MAYKRSRQAFETDLQKQESPFVVYGTPLPPLDEHARDDGSYVPVWKQEVTDDRGRKRLHGAFTGGFSAGYYNTVGSKEGWTPSTFVSSRTNRAKDGKNVVQQKAEDFMDEEDVREAEESRNLSTTDGFAGFGTGDDPIHRSVMSDLFKPAEDSMGFKLLNKMGWKQGQGIGPRVRRKADPEDETSESHLFAPEDVAMISFVKKNDNKGLGYDDESGPTTTVNASLKSTSITTAQAQSDEEDDGHPGLNFASRSKKVSKANRGGFGVGILNDTGSDEEDPYAMGPKISYNKTLGGDKKSKKKQTASINNANPTLKSKPLFISKKLSTMKNALRKCHDGRLPLEGFVLADELDGFSTMSLADDKYKPPEVPADWKPSRITQDLTENSGLQPTTSKQNNAAATPHTITSRSQALGEAILPGKSVFDYLTPAARDRLVAATGKQNLPQALGETLSGTDASGISSVPAVQLPYLDTSTARQALSRSTAGGFMPYAEDLQKRARYKLFLEVSSGLKAEADTSIRVTGMSDEEYTNELNEFVRAAEVFKPVSSGLSSRFTSSSASNTSTTNNTLDVNKSYTTEDLISRPTKKPEDPAEVAAKLNMFGPLTRTVITFQPTRLVSKRFGVEFMGAVPDTFPTTTASVNPSQPYQSSGEDEGTAPQFQSGGFITQGEENQAHDPSASAQSQQDTNPSLITGERNTPTNPSTVAPSSAAINPDINEALEQERPGQAVFRAIFGSDDEDEDD